MGTEDTIIRLDRSIRLVYPDWVKEIVCPSLESVGPPEYDLAKIKLWLHDHQKGDKWVMGHTIYWHLKETDGLKNCLGYQDALEIQKKGIFVFRKFFGDKMLLFWKSVVRHSSDSFGLPCIYGSVDDVTVHWCWLGNGFVEYRPAACFPD